MQTACRHCGAQPKTSARFFGSVVCDIACAKEIWKKLPTQAQRLINGNGDEGDITESEKQTATTILLIKKLFENPNLLDTPTKLFFIESLDNETLATLLKEKAQNPLLEFLTTNQSEIVEFWHAQCTKRDLLQSYVVRSAEYRRTTEFSPKELIAIWKAQNRVTEKIRQELQNLTLPEEFPSVYALIEVWLLDNRTEPEGIKMLSELLKHSAVDAKKRKKILAKITVTGKSVFNLERYELDLRSDDEDGELDWIGAEEDLLETTEHLFMLFFDNNFRSGRLAYYGTEENNRGWQSIAYVSYDKMTEMLQKFVVLGQEPVDTEYFSYFVNTDREPYPVRLDYGDLHYEEDGYDDEDEYNINYIAYVNKKWLNNIRSIYKNELQNLYRNWE